MPALSELLSPATKITAREFPDLLTGNGVSRQVSSRFAYSNLREVATSRAPILLTPASAQAFSAMATNDFEVVLRAIHHAKLISDAFGFPIAAFDQAYGNVRDALASAVATVHPSYAEVGDARLASGNRFFRTFTHVFTTNYDLLTYWSFMKDYAGAMVDFFFKSNGWAFDSASGILHPGSRGIYYLHGALMLSEDEIGRAIKLVHENGSPFLLANVTQQFSTERLPLFVSEGTFTQKIEHISRQAYLRFCLDQLATGRGNLMVLGHGLDEGCDRHIVDAIAKSKRRRIAISVWGADQARAQAEIERLTRRFEDLPGGGSRELLFFDQRDVNPWGQSPID